MSGPQLCDAPKCTNQAVTFDDGLGFACSDHAPNEAVKTR